jgi:hypothetical protein
MSESTPQDKPNDKSDDRPKKGLSIERSTAGEGPLPPGPPSPGAGVPAPEPRPADTRPAERTMGPPPKQEVRADQPEPSGPDSAGPEAKQQAEAGDAVRSGDYWVFHGAVTDVEFEVHVTDQSRDTGPPEITPGPRDTRPPEITPGPRDTRPPEITPGPRDTRPPESTPGEWRPQAESGAAEGPDRDAPSPASSDAANRDSDPFRFILPTETPPSRVPLEGYGVSDSPVAPMNTTGPGPDNFVVPPSPGPMVPSGGDAIPGAGDARPPERTPGEWKSPPESGSSQGLRRGAESPVRVEGLALEPVTVDLRNETPSIVRLDDSTDPQKPRSRLPRRLLLAGLGGVGLLGFGGWAVYSATTGDDTKPALSSDPSPATAGGVLASPTTRPATSTPTQPPPEPTAPPTPLASAEPPAVAPVPSTAPPPQPTMPAPTEPPATATATTTATASATPTATPSPTPVITEEGEPPSSGGGTGGT